MKKADHSQYAIAGGLVGAGVIGAFALWVTKLRVIDLIYQAIAGTHGLGNRVAAASASTPA
jgi:hypothetical protein